MKIRSTTVTLLFSASPAAADFGHLGELAGHAHWVALGAAAVAAAISAALVKQRKSSEKAEEPSSATEETEEAAS